GVRCASSRPEIRSAACTTAPTSEMTRIGRGSVTVPGRIEAVQPARPGTSSRRTVVVGVVVMVLSCLRGWMSVDLRGAQGDGVDGADEGVEVDLVVGRGAD